MDDTGAELDACLRTMQAQSEEIRALRQMLGAAMELLEAREPTTAVTLKRNRGRPLKRTNANKAELLRAFEAMSRSEERRVGKECA